MRLLITLFGIFLINYSMAQTTVTHPADTSKSKQKRVPSPFSGSSHNCGGPADTSRQKTSVPPRKMIHGCNASSITSTEDIWVQLTVRINPQGDVVSCSVNSAKTTTTDSDIIRQVRALVLDQVKYAPKEGKGIDIVELRIHVTAN